MRSTFAALVAFIAVIGTAMGSAIGPATAQQAEDWPQRPVRILVGIAPGGLPDTAARVVARQLSISLGQGVVVENRPGAGGNIAAQAVATSPPDGYTLLLTGNNHATNPILLPNPSFDYERDIVPVAMVAEARMLLVASPQLPANNIGEVLALAKRDPSALNFAIAPIGTPGHLGAELFLQMSGANIAIVPYTGIGPALPDLMAGRVQLVIGAIPSVYPLVANGNLKALAITSLQRSPFVADIPTVAESGLPGFEVNAWVCLMAPGKTPQAIVDKINAEVGKALQTSDVRENFAKQGAAPSIMTAPQLGRFIKEEETKWARVLKNARAK
jgi:tripartite-type tricarboxylate transporter receptor subunit TctC